ncbi:MAG: TonB-dependent receptor [Gammaproteobacteria bacterium]|nr:TonB-dependent receptor [Gammaproteobacteria bacterium]
MKCRRRTKLGMMVLSALASPAGWAVTSLSDIVVKGEGLDEANSAFSVNVISAETMQNIHLDQPYRFLEQVPGFSLGSYRQGGVSDVFSMRGFSSGGHGGDAAVFIDGIPLNEAMSHADGYADVNVLIPLEVQKVVVYRGPVSPLYGNFARGGAIALTTRKGGEYQNADLSFGQWNTHDAQIALGGTFGALETNIAVESYHTDGWRENSRYDKSNATARLSYDINDRSEVSFSLRAHGGQWDGPGYEPKDQFDDDDRRRLLAPNAENDGGEKTFTTGRIDYNHVLNEDAKLLVFGYSTEMEWTRYSKFGYTPGGQSESTYDRPVFGMGASYNSKKSVAGYPSNWVVGLEYYGEDTSYQNYSTSNRVRQVQNVDRVFEMNTTSLFAQLDMDITPQFRPTLGLRYDTFSGTYENNDPGGTPFKEDMNSYNHISPKLGVRSTLSDAWELRGSISNGFSLPADEAKYDPALNVDPVEIWQYEIGVSGMPTSTIYTDLAYFILDTSDEILEDPIGSGDFRNAGKTRRNGIEGEMRYTTPVPYMDVMANFTWIDSEIRKNSDSTVQGKELTNIPEYLVTLNLNYAPPAGLGAKASWRKVGPYYLTGDNSESYDGFDLLNVGIFYTQKLEENRSMRWYLDVNNILDEVYAEAVFSGFGTTNYAPAPPANIAAGVSLSF